MKKILLLVLFLSLLLVYLYRDILLSLVFSPTDTSLQKGVSLQKVQERKDTEQTENTNDPIEPITIIAEGLRIPWEIAFLPNGDYLVTERPGNILRIGTDRKIIQIDGVVHQGEGGLLGLALDPNFEQNDYIYIYLTSQSPDGSGLINRVERYTLNGSTVRNRKIVLDNIPGARFHDGGRIKFGPDNKLYITVGDAQNEDAAQNPNNLNGQILRINLDGSIPEDNPTDSAMYSYGHRNPQGLTWDSFGTLWSTEHGRSGPASGYDEVNRIVPGQNYGWPIIQGDESAEDMQIPIIHSGPRETWAPGDAEYIDGHIFFTGLRGEALYEAELNDQETDIVNTKAHFYKEFGRIRTARLGPDGYLYILTSNTDGRGEVRENDDKIIKIHMSVFE